MEPAAIHARYSDWRPVKGRKVLQIILEVPLERQDEVLRYLGAPLPDRDIEVAVARLRDTEKPKGGPLAREAGILCNATKFRQFLGAKLGVAPNTVDAATYMRNHCNVSSRAKLDHDEQAAKAFVALRDEFNDWLLEG